MPILLEPGSCCFEIMSPLELLHNKRKYFYIPHTDRHSENEVDQNLWGVYQDDSQLWVGEMCKVVEFTRGVGSFQLIPLIFFSFEGLPRVFYYLGVLLGDCSQTSIFAVF